MWHCQIFLVTPLFHLCLEAPDDFQGIVSVDTLLKSILGSRPYDLIRPEEVSSIGRPSNIYT